MTELKSDLSQAYLDTITAWRDDMEVKLRAEYNWLSLAGLHWLSEGDNTIGGDPSSDIPLPPTSAPADLGVITLNHGSMHLRVLADEPVYADNQPITDAIIHDDHAPEGASMIKVRDLMFNMVRRGDQYGVRVRDPHNPNRLNFKGRIWYPIDLAYRVQARFHPHASMRQIEVENTIGTLSTMDSPGTITFELNGQAYEWIAFNSGGDLWLIFKDGTSGVETYGLARYMVASMDENGVVDLDFNKTYNPPCSFTEYATCPLPPKENKITAPIKAGEKFAGK